MDLSPLTLPAATPADRPPPADWPSLVAACPSRSIQAVLQGLRVRTFEAGRVVLDAPEPLARTALLRREELALALSKAAGRPVVIEIYADTAASRVGEAPGAASSAAAAPARASPQPLAPSSMSDHPLVRQAAELLSARLIRVERRESSNG